MAAWWRGAPAHEGEGDHQAGLTAPLEPLIPPEFRRARLDSSAVVPRRAADQRVRLWGTGPGASAVCCSAVRACMSLLARCACASCAFGSCAPLFLLVDTTVWMMDSRFPHVHVHLNLSVTTGFIRLKVVSRPGAVMSVHDVCALPITSNKPAECRDLLLYYAYVDLRSAQSDVCDWMRSNCEALGLVGRVRVAKDGINATVGGECVAISEHIAAVRAHHLLGPENIDFKQAPWPPDCSAAAVAEAGFDDLSVAACKDVVALGRSSGIQKETCCTLCYQPALSQVCECPTCPATVGQMGQPECRRLCLLTECRLDLIVLTGMSATSRGCGSKLAGT